MQRVGPLQPLCNLFSSLTKNLELRLTQRETFLVATPVKK